MKREIKRVRFVVIAVLLFCGMAMQTRAANAGLTSSGTLLALSQHEVPGRAQRTLTFEERVSYQALSKKFTGVIASGQKRMPIPSRHSMR